MGLETKAEIVDFFIRDVDFEGWHGLGTFPVAFLKLKDVYGEETSVMYVLSRFFSPIKSKVSGIEEKQK